MRKRYLWIDQRGADLYWAAPGNIDISATGRGTLVHWSWMAENGGPGLLRGMQAWRAPLDANNYFQPYWGRGVAVKSGGVEHATEDVDRAVTAAGWELTGVTWDFTSGRVVLYRDGVEHGEGLTGVPAPVGSAARIYLGNPYSATPFEDLFLRDWNLHLCGLAIWNGVMTDTQMAALYARGRRYRMGESDGTGTLTLLATFGSGYDADVAGGDGTLHTTPGVPANRYCLLDDGALRLGRRSFALGMPRQDLSDDDRKPINAVLPVMFDYEHHMYDYVSTSDEADHSRLRITPGHDGNRMLGAYMPRGPVLEGGLRPPATYRQLVHMARTENVAGKGSRLGPIAYRYQHPVSSGVFDWFGSGRSFRVISDSGNTATSFKIGLSGTFADGYWSGASLVFVNGNCAGRRLLATGYDAATGFVTLEAALPAVPAASSVGVLNFTPRLMGIWSNQGFAQEQCLDGYLWNEHEGVGQFVELEWVFSRAESSSGEHIHALRYDRGRCAFMTGNPNGVYGKMLGEEDATYGAGFRLQKVEIDGPQEFQLLEKQGNGEGPSLSDNFALLAGGKSTRVWRQDGVRWDKSRPVKVSDWSAVVADLEAAGSWRHTNVSAPVVVSYDEGAERVTALVVGQDPDGVQRLGYVQGTWDGETGRIAWVDEEAPAGKPNPFIRLDVLRTDAERDAPANEVKPVAVLEAGDGSWSLLYRACPAQSDKFETYALHGSPDRWSFDPREHWSRSNPIVPVFGGPDPVLPDGGGLNSWANMDADWDVCRNPWATDARMAFWGVGRGKSIQNRYLPDQKTMFANDCRPLVVIAGADPRSMAPLPYGNAITPAAGPQVHVTTCAVMGREDRLVVLSDGSFGFTYGIGLYVSEDGQHFEELFEAEGGSESFIPRGELPGEPDRLYPSRPFRLGGRQVFYYTGSVPGFVNFAWQRWEGETRYGLGSGETGGWIETAMLRRPTGGWKALTVNCEPNDGAVRVEVIDPEDEEVISGCSAAECGAVGDVIDGVVRWSGGGLEKVTAEFIRLRFILSRPSVSAASPTLYAWAIADRGLERPVASALRVDGAVNPAMVTRRRPTFSWAYEDANGLAQGAYQVLVSSSEELLREGSGDTWDSGDVESGLRQAEYGGNSLGDVTTYFWKVRVRNSEGVWSEEW